MKGPQARTSVLVPDAGSAVRFPIHIPETRMTFLIGRVLGTRIKAAEASRTRILIYSYIVEAEAGITHTGGLEEHQRGIPYSRFMIR